MLPPIRPSLLRQLNERRVLEEIRHRGPLSRADLTRVLGVSAPTISSAVASLLNAGLLEEGDPAPGGIGRPGKLLRLASSGVQVLGVVIDSARCSVVVAGLDGQVHADKGCEFSTPSTYPDLLDAIAAAVDPLLRGDAETLGLGVSVPGLLNRRRQETVLSPNLHLTDGRSLGPDLAARFGIECEIFQESHALCLGERFYGLARDVDDFAMLDLTTGLGLGVVSGGRQLLGHSGLAGELGHITAVPDGLPCGCGNHGCLETVATDSALAAALSRRLERPVDVAEAVRRVQERDPSVSADLERVSEFQAIALAAVINVFNPEVVFVYTRLLDADDATFERVKERTRERSLKPSFADCRIERARGNKSLGAVAGILTHLTDSHAPTLEG